ncbi:DUF4350 domain-containing protein [Paenibacillus sp. CC-CFT747]|nr:DUF4350 domain-containing protein [Paenibacillus sp. CC-CFT747]
MLLGFWVVQPATRNLPAYLSFSADADGIKAWRELLQERGPQVKEWRLGWDRLPEGTGHLLVAVQPAGVTKEEKERLLRWVERGNGFLLFHRSPDGWSTWSVAKVAASGISRSAPGELRRVTGPGVPAGTDAEARVETADRLLPAREAEVLLSDEAGVLASRQPAGRGSLTVVLAPEWLTNGQIAKESHFDLVWPLMAGGWSTVLVDEAHHGYRTKPGLLAVYPAWLVLAGLQLAAALLLWLWLRGKRFGPVYTPREWTVRRSDETLLAAAGWYERLGSRAEALGHQQRFLRQLLDERWGLRPGATPQEAAEAARLRWSEPEAERLARLLQEPGPDRGVQAFVERTREAGELIRRIEKEGRDE